MQAGLGAEAGVADRDAVLMTVLVEQARRVQVERVAFAFAGQFFHRPAEEWAKAREVFAGAGEALKETRERRLAGHAFDAEQLRHHRIAPQVGDVRELLGPTEQALHKAEHFGQRRERVVRGRLGVRQALRHQLAPAALVQERPKRRCPGVRAGLLGGAIDLGGLAGALELDLFGHSLVQRGGARRLDCFHSPPFTSQTAAPLPLHRYGLGAGAVSPLWLDRCDGRESSDWLDVLYLLRRDGLRCEPRARIFPAVECIGPRLARKFQRLARCLREKRKTRSYRCTLPSTAGCKARGM